MEAIKQIRAIVVIPALNEEKTISNVICGAIKLAPVLVVNDGSRDNTASVARKAGAIVLDLPKNVGVDRALAAGFKEASRLGYEVVATIDADGQHDTAILRSIMEPVVSGRFDMCHSCRTNYCRPSEWLLRRYSYHMYGLGDVLSGLKAFSLKTVFEPHEAMVSRPSLGTALPWAAVNDGASIAEVFITVSEREEGDTPRIGGLFKANYRVVKALLRLIYWDMRSLLQDPARFYRTRFKNRSCQRVILE